MAAKGAQQSKKGNKHATNSHRRERKHGHGPSKFVAKAGKRAARYTSPPPVNHDKLKARVSGEQQFFNDGTPYMLREEHRLASGAVWVTHTNIVGTWDSSRKHFVRHSSRRFT